MRKLAGTTLAVALAAATIGTWSKPIFVTNAAALATGHEIGPRVGERTPAAVIADRFPNEADMLRPLDLMRSPHSLAHAPVAWVAGKGDKLAFNMAECGPHDLQSATTGCFANVRPTPAPPRGSAVARRTGSSTSDVVRAPVAATDAPASCKYSLPAATARLERVLARVKGVQARPEPEACADYRSGLFEMAQARAVTAVCKTGPDRDHDLVKIDGAVESINGTIARDCGSI